VWNEPTLVSFLIVFLLYCCYQPLRFSIEDPERQARYAAVFAILAGAFVPLNFIAVRLAQAYTHPRVLSVSGGNMPGAMRLTFLLSLAAVTMLYLTLRRLELTAKHAAFTLRAVRRPADAASSDAEERPPQMLERPALAGVGRD
jgi:heme exporter protein C